MSELSVRLVETSEGRILAEYYDGPQVETPTVWVEYQQMSDGSTRVIREVIQK